MLTDKMFKDDRSQAAGRPEEGRRNEDENKWDSFMQAVDMFSSDFLENGREDTEVQRRENQAE